MKLQRIFSCITGVLIAVGFSASQASAGTGPECPLAIEINALRGGSPTVSVGSTKNITAKARISKGSAVDGTTIDTQLRIEAVDGENVISRKFAGPIRLGVGKGGQGAKLTMDILSCDNAAGVIVFAATFTGVTAPECTVTRTITKTCK